MHPVIAKYVTAYHNTEGNSTQKVKKILMTYSAAWEWYASESLVADLIDDMNITAEDIVDFLIGAYESEGGSKEFRHAVSALQVCVQKEKFAHRVEQTVKMDEFKQFKQDEVFGYESDLYASHDILNAMQY